MPSSKKRQKTSLSSSESSEADAAAGSFHPRNADASASKESPPDKKKKEEKMTKRQRRKQGANPKQAWPQQPKVSSMEARAKAQLQVAGLYKTGAQGSKKPAPTFDLEAAELRFGRLLGGTEQRTRHKAVLQLQQYLKVQSQMVESNEEEEEDPKDERGLSELDLLKLWKGLWYALFLADKVPVQEELSKRLSELLWCVAGTPEEDEYAAQVYLDMREADDDDDDVVMEEVANTLHEFDEDGDHEHEEDPEEEDDARSEEEENDSQDDEDESSEGSLQEDDVDDEDEEKYQPVLEGDDNYDDDDEEEEEQDDLQLKHCRGAHLVSLFCKTFFVTLQREWGNMDKHRIDKFYTLIRYMMAQIYKYMAKRHWNRGIIFLLNDVIRDEVLFQVPNGLRFHLIDLSMEELAKVNATEAPMPLTEATFLDCIDPYLAVAQNVDDKLVHARTMEQIFGKFLHEYSVVSEVAVRADNAEDNVTVEGAELIMDQVHVGTVAKFLFELASNTETQDRFRKDLYDMHKAYMKRLKKVGKDVELDNAIGDEQEDYTIDSEQGETTNDALEKEDLPEELPEKTSESKKKKKKKKKHKAEPERVEVEPEPAQSPEPARKKIKKEKKKASEGNASGLSKGGNVDTSPLALAETAAEASEEVITISRSEQKKAASAEKVKAERKKKKKKKHSETTPDRKESDSSAKSESEEKRVKFGKFNFSKSHTASMKALENLETPSTASRTPDRSILRFNITSADKIPRNDKPRGSKKRKKGRASF